MIFGRLTGLFVRRRLLILYERMGEMKRRFRLIIFALPMAREEITGAV